MGFRYLLQLHTLKPLLCKTHQCALHPSDIIDPDLVDRFTMDGSIPVMDWFLGREMHAGGENDLQDQSCHEREHTEIIWGPELLAQYLDQYTAINAMQWGYAGHMLASTTSAELSGALPAGSWDTFHVDKSGASQGRTTTLAERGVEESYPGATLLHCSAFASYPVRIPDLVRSDLPSFSASLAVFRKHTRVRACWQVRGFDVAVIGSITPWLEALLLNHNALSVTTVDYNTQFGKCAIRLFASNQLHIRQQVSVLKILIATISRSNWQKLELASSTSSADICDFDFVFFAATVPGQSAAPHDVHAADQVQSYLLAARLFDMICVCAHCINLAQSSSPGGQSARTDCTLELGRHLLPSPAAMSCSSHRAIEQGNIGASGLAAALPPKVSRRMC
eukprot:SAG31_NODE_3197_length_4567_cov_2.365040_4_plen_393_part_00